MQNWNPGEKNIFEQGERYNELYISYFRKLYKYGNKFSKDSALLQDCIQDVFADFWQNRHKWSGINSHESYIFSAFRYTLFRKIKQANKFVENTSDTTDPVFSPEDLIIAQQSDAEHAGKLREALTTLTARQREAIYLRFYVGLSYEEVSKVLNISVKATYKIMARSLKALKDTMLLPLGVLLQLLNSW